LGELDQVVQVLAEFARGFERTSNTHLALPRSPSSTRRRMASAGQGISGRPCRHRHRNPTGSGSPHSNGWNDGHPL